MQVPVAQGCIDVALRLPGVVILSEAQAQIYLDTLKTQAETEKINAEKRESDENNAQRAHELSMKDVRKLELKAELAKLQGQPPTKRKKSKVSLKSIANFKPTKPRKPMTDQQREDYNRKRREKAKLDKANSNR